MKAGGLLRQVKWISGVRVFVSFLCGSSELELNLPSLYCREILCSIVQLSWNRTSLSSLWILRRACQDKGDYHHQRNGNKHSPIFQPADTWTNNYLFDDDIRCTVIIPRASDVNEFIVCFLEKTWKKVVTSVIMRNCWLFQLVCLCFCVRTRTCRPTHSLVYPGWKCVFVWTLTKWFLNIWL